MLRPKTALIVGTALLTAVSLPAFAGGSNKREAIVINGQVNLGNVWSTVNTTIRDVAGDAGAAASSVGNNAEIVTFSDTAVTSDQYNNGAIGSAVNAKVQGVGGDVSLAASTACNSLSVSTDPHVTSVKSRQTCDMKDPSAAVTANVNTVAGNVGIGATAVANQVQIDSNAARFPVTNLQTNYGDVISTATARVAHVGGSASVSAAAVGNTAQIVQY